MVTDVFKEIKHRQIEIDGLQSRVKTVIEEIRILKLQAGGEQTKPKKQSLYNKIISYLYDKI